MAMKRLRATSPYPLKKEELVCMLVMLNYPSFIGFTSGWLLCTSLGQLNIIGRIIRSSGRIHVIPKWRPVACVASVPVRKKSSQTIFRKHAARKLGREIEGTLARRPPIFEKPVRPRTGASDWCGIVTMIDR